MSSKTCGTEYVNTACDIAPYDYDVTQTHCSLCTCNALCDYDDTRCANSRTSSTTATTAFHWETGFEDSGGLFEDATAAMSKMLPVLGCHYTATDTTNPMSDAG